MKKQASILCLILLILSLFVNRTIPVSAEGIAASAAPIAGDSQPKEETTLSTEDICDALSRLVEKGRQWIEHQKEHIPEEIMWILKVLRVAQHFFRG